MTREEFFAKIQKETKAQFGVDSKELTYKLDPGVVALANVVYDQLIAKEQTDGEEAKS